MSLHSFFVSNDVIAVCGRKGRGKILASDLQNAPLVVRQHIARRRIPHPPTTRCIPSPYGVANSQVDRFTQSKAVHVLLRFVCSSGMDSTPNASPRLSINSEPYKFCTLQGEAVSEFLVRSNGHHMTQLGARSADHETGAGSFICLHLLY